MTREQVSKLPDEVLLTTVEAAELLQLRPQTLAKWRLVGSGVALPYLRIGRRVVRYRKAEVEAFMVRSQEAGS